MRDTGGRNIDEMEAAIKSYLGLQNTAAEPQTDRTLHGHTYCGLLNVTFYFLSQNPQN